MLIINPELNIAARNRDTKTSIANILATEDIDPRAITWLFNLWDDGYYYVDAPNVYSRLNDITAGYYSSIVFPFYITYILYCLFNIEEQRFIQDFDSSRVLKYPRETRELFLTYAELNRINLTNNSYLYSSFIASLGSYEILKKESKKLFGIDLLDLTEDVSIYQVVEKLFTDVGYNDEYIFNYINIISTDNKLLTTRLILDYFKVTNNNTQKILSLISNWKIDETQIFRLS